MHVSMHAPRVGRGVSAPTARSTCSRGVGVSWTSFRGLLRVPPACATSVEEAPAVGPTTRIDLARITELQQKFQMYDVDGSGSLDKAEVCKLLQSTEGGLEIPLDDWMSTEEVDKVFDQYDFDKNGTISFDEFTQLVMDNILLEGKLAEYRDAFLALDFNGNGTLSATEIATLFANLGSPLSYEKLVDLFARYDKDASGQIDFGEFLYMFRDRLLDLQQVLSYIQSNGVDQSVMLDEEGTNGQVHVIFSDTELQEYLSSSEYVLLFVALTWCRPCKAMQRPFQKLAGHYPNMAFLKLFGNANPCTKVLFKQQLKILSTPSFIIYKNGERVASCSGAKKEKWEALLRDTVADPSKMPAKPVYPCPAPAMASQG